MRDPQSTVGPLLLEMPVIGRGSGARSNGCAVGSVVHGDLHHVRLEPSAADDRPGQGHQMRLLDRYAYKGQNTDDYPAEPDELDREED